MFQRWVAQKIRLKDIAKENFSEGDNSLEINGLKVNRIRAMGSVIQKFVADSGKYAHIIMDDGTENIRVRGFDESVENLSAFEIGDIIDVFGRVRKYEEELYIIPDIATKVEDPNYLIVRKLELKKIYKEEEAPRSEEKKAEVMPSLKREEIKHIIIHEKKDKTEEMFIEEEIVEGVLESPKVVLPEEKELSPRKRVVNYILENDKGQGVDYTHVIKNAGLDQGIVENVLTDLMNEGEIFEPRAGKIKILG